MEYDLNPSTLLFLMAILSVVPFVAIMTSSFVKLAVVFSILRNALGLQQIPPNMAIYGLAIILTIYIMAPVGITVYNAVQAERGAEKAEETEIFKPGVAPEGTNELLALILINGIEPMRDFLSKHAQETEIRFFEKSAQKLWPEELHQDLNKNNFLILVPAFTVSELRSAFEIGFLIYLPFIAIDLVISNILLAMGMMMVSPMTISLPFKLLLFVLVDGWSRLVHSLVLTYQ